MGSTSAIHQLHLILQINNHLHIRSSKLHTNKMYIPSAQQILTTGLAMTGCMTLKKGDTVSSGKVLDFAVEKCLDSDGNQRCTKPFLVSKSTSTTLSGALRAPSATPLLRSRMLQ